MRTPPGDGLGDGTGGSGVGVGVGAPPTHPQAMNRTAPTIDAWIVQRRHGTSSEPARAQAGMPTSRTTRQLPRAGNSRDQESSANRLIVRPAYGVRPPDAVS